MSGPTCFVIGAGIVPLRCVEILTANGFDIRGVYSADGSLETVARERAWPHSASRSELEQTLLRESYDFLFSINNGWVIPREVIAKARRATINYHDSPLPKYAGLHATSWALLHGERTHGVRWHEVTDTIDGGRIYKQRDLNIDPTDTAFALNTKCYEAAVASFRELASELRERRERPTAQPAFERSYFGMRDRPRAACTLSFRQPAHDLRNLVRALDFGPARNPLGLPKLFLGGDFVVVREALVHEGSSASEPGQVVSLDAAGLRVATLTSDVTLRHPMSLAGVSLDPDELRSRFGLEQGSVLPELTAEGAESISQTYSALCKHEAGWVRRLSSLAPFAHPYTIAHVGTGQLDARAPLSALWAALGELAEPVRAKQALCCFAAYAARLSAEPTFDLGLCTDAQATPFPALFAPVVPLRIASTVEQDFSGFAASFERELTRCVRMGTYARDLQLRFPELRDQSQAHFPLVLARFGRPAELDSSVIGSQLVLAAYADGSTPELVHDGSLMPFQVDAIASQLAQIARASLSHPSTPIARLSLIDDAERERILVTWNQTQAPYPLDQSIHGLVSLTAERNPDAPAVRFGDVSISFATLDRRSAQLARKLQSLGAGRGSLVALCLERSLDLVVGLLGILKAGAAYVPIDPSYPAERVSTMLADSEPAAIVTQGSVRDRFFVGLAGVVSLDEQRAELETLDPNSARVETHPEDLAYVIYTSGSTGKPKGVRIQHRALINHSWAIARNYRLGPGDRMLCSASIGFDVAGEQIYPALFGGAEVVVRPDDLFESLGRFDRFARDERISAMVLPTALWHEWVRELTSSQKSIPPSLRVLSVGTEKALAEQLTAWQLASEGRVSFFQGYGPTEATVTCTMYVHDGSVFDRTRALPIGRPLPNTQAYILDPNLEPVPIGIPGELYVGGDGLAQGYHRRPELTAEKFITHPFLPSERLYRTGDLARYEPDGQIIYIGRSDFQVKLRGFRIELGEIEDVLRTDPAVDEAVVALREDRPGQKRLVGYVVAKSGMQLAAAQLKTFAAEHLPEYMVPSAIVILTHFPMTRNQKVDRTALPPPSSDEAPVALPQTELEHALVRIWTEQLGVAVRGVHDNFYDLGGDSLLAVRVLTNLEAELGAYTTLSAFNREPTIAHLAALLATPGASSEEELVVSIQQGKSRPPLWLIHAVGGHVTFGQRLRPHMDAEQPIVGIEARGLDGKRPPLEAVEAMASTYLELIRAKQPHGPYFLAGPSCGGLIALEIAQRLQQQGEEIGLLALLDTWGPNYPRRTSLSIRIADHVREFRTLPTWTARLQRVRAAITRSLNPEQRRMPGAGRVVAPRYDALDGIERDGTLLRAIERVTRANERANFNYVPRPYAGRLLLLRAEQTFDWIGMRFDDPYNDWGSIARGGVHAVSFPCSHVELADEPPPEAGRVLQEEIRRVLEERGHHGSLPTAARPAGVTAASVAGTSPPANLSS